MPEQPLVHYPSQERDVVNETLCGIVDPVTDPPSPASFVGSVIPDFVTCPDCRAAMSSVL